MGGGTSRTSVCQQLSVPGLVLYPVTDFYSCGVKFSMALRASSAAESPVIYVLLSESSRFKSEVSGQASVQYMSLCVLGCVYQLLSANKMSVNV